MAKFTRTNFISIVFGIPIIFTGIFISLFLSYYIYSIEKNENKIRFEYEVEDITKRIQYQMVRYEEVLNHTKAFIQGSKDVSKNEFNQFFKEINLLENYPGIRGLGLALRLSPGEIKNRLQEIRKKYGTLRVWPEGKRDYLFPAVYLHPEDADNKKAIGYDMYSDEVRREAMNQAWESGKPQLTGRVILVQERGKESQPGFNLYVPLYRNDKNIVTAQERKDALIGFVYSPFRTRDLFNSMLTNSKVGMEVEIFDSESMSKNSALFDRETKSKSTYFLSPILKTRKKLFLYGREFTIRFQSSPEFKLKSEILAPAIILFSGLLATFFLFYIIMITKRQAVISQNSELALQSALHSRDEFISIASHELKTPLTSIKLQTQMFKKWLLKDSDETQLRVKSNTFVTKTEKQAIRLERLIDDMLDITRIKSGKLKIVKEEFSLNTLIQDILFHMKEQFKNIPNGAPEVKFGKNVIGMWDKMRIEQVITNLLTNAIKYGNNKSIEIRTESDAKNVYLTVKDYGIGISPEFQDKIFNRFERANVSATEISGLGIGLYITQQIVKSHKGSIKVNSTPQQGSQFIVILPKST